MYADATGGCKTLPKQVYKYAFEPTGLLGRHLSSTLRQELCEKSVLPTNTTHRALSEIEPRKLTPHIKPPFLVAVRHACSPWEIPKRSATFDKRTPVSLSG